MSQMIVLIVLMKFLAITNFDGSLKNVNVNKTIAFYNVENLFDTINDAKTYDDDYTPTGKNHFSTKDYFHKIKNTAKVISEIGNNKTSAGPELIGLAEVENFQVLNDLIETEILKHNHYQIIHFDSPDQRGIDVALIYNENQFSPIESEAIEVKLWTERGERIYTRDVLYVSGILDDEVIHVFVNHWPSRRGGKSRSDSKRMKAAYLVKQKLDDILIVEPNAKVIILGDFNDDPIDKSIRHGLLLPSKTELSLSKFLFNPMKKMFQKGMNTLAYQDGINLFDQIIISNTLLKKEKNQEGLVFQRAGVYNPSYLITQKGKYKGYPYRSFQNNHFAGGYSDHFPVFIELKNVSSP